MNILNNPRATKVSLFVSALAISSAMAVAYNHQALADVPALTQQLHNLQSSETGAVEPVPSTAYDVRVHDALIEHLSNASAAATLGMQSENPDVRASSKAIHDSIESQMPALHQGRDIAIRTHLDAINNDDKGVR